jgi:hypothetical protein
MQSIAITDYLAPQNLGALAEKTLADLTVLLKQY